MSRAGSPSPASVALARPSCETPCQELRALKSVVRQNKIATERELSILRREAQERSVTHNEKLDAIMGEIQGLREFVEEWARGGKSR